MLRFTPPFPGRHATAQTNAGKINSSIRNMMIVHDLLL